MTSCIPWLLVLSSTFKASSIVSSNSLLPSWHSLPFVPLILLANLHPFKFFSPLSQIFKIYFYFYSLFFIFFWQESSLLLLCTENSTVHTQPSLVASSLAFAFSSLAMRATDFGPRTLPPQWRRICGRRGSQPAVHFLRLSNHASHAVLSPCSQLTGIYNCSEQKQPVSD